MKKTPNKRNKWIASWSYNDYGGCADYDNFGPFSSCEDAFSKLKKAIVDQLNDVIKHEPHALVNGLHIKKSDIGRIANNYIHRLKVDIKHSKASINISIYDEDVDGEYTFEIEKIKS